MPVLIRGESTKVVSRRNPIRVEEGNLSNHGVFEEGNSKPSRQWKIGSWI